MVVLNPIVCPECKNELQPCDLGVRLDGEDLVRICLFCDHEVIIK